jgi:hypothetical protein
MSTPSRINKKARAWSEVWAKCSSTSASIFAKSTPDKAAVDVAVDVAVNVDEEPQGQGSDESSLLCEDDEMVGGFGVGDHKGDSLLTTPG